MATKKGNGHTTVTVEMVEILREIRGELKGLRGAVNATNERLDVTNQRLDVTNERLDVMHEDLLAVGAGLTTLTNAVSGLRGETRP